MPSDERTLEQKLEALATNAGATPGEAEVARAMLEKHRARLRDSKTKSRSLSREQILQTPSHMSVRGVRIRYPSGQWVHLDEDQVDWEMVESHRLWYRFNGEEMKQARPTRRELA